MSGGASANWIAPAAGVTLRRQAGGDARAAALRRRPSARSTRVRKHLSRIKGGRLARHAASGASRDARDLGRAGRRSGGDRLGPDRARSDHAGRRARDRRALSSSICPPRSTRALNDPANETPEAGRPGLRQQPTSRSSRGRPMRLRAAEAAVRARRLRVRLARRAMSKARRARSRPRMPSSRATCARRAAAP